MDCTSSWPILVWRDCRRFPMVRTPLKSSPCGTEHPNCYWVPIGTVPRWMYGVLVAFLRKWHRGCLYSPVGVICKYRYIRFDFAFSWSTNLTRVCILLTTGITVISCSKYFNVEVHRMVIRGRPSCVYHILILNFHNGGNIPSPTLYRCNC